MAGNIVIKGARVHNLKNIDLEIPRGRFVVITGVSGSGKSSLAFDTVYAEGQRRYLESLGVDARQLLQRLEQPDVDSIDGLSPTIAVQQNPGLASPRSTVGTLTDIYDYLRLLFARVGQPLCVTCGREIIAHTIEQIVDRVLALEAQIRIVVLAPISIPSEVDVKDRLAEFVRQGFARVMINGAMRDLGDEAGLDTAAVRQLDLVIDRLSVRPGIEKRLADSLEVASRHGGQRVRIKILGGNEPHSEHEAIFSLRFICVHCDTAMPEITPSLFSFNSPQGACPACNGLGTVAPTRGRRDGTRGPEDAAAACPECNGARLKRESRAVRVAGRDIVEVAAWPVSQALEFFATLALGEERKIVGQKIVAQMVRRFRVLAELGLEYLSLDRPAATLSGGELQRARLARQIGSGLAGILYVLDEPSLGLHQKDNIKLVKLLKQLRDDGNTVLVVEHDRETMLAADYLIDMGPAAGVQGGEVVAHGTPAEIGRNPRSLTGRYLSGAAKMPMPRQRRAGSGHFLSVRNASMRNLKSLTVEIPIGVLTCVTGVSGSGKSTLVMEVLYAGVSARLQRRKDNGSAEITGWENFARIIGVDQSPIGRTPRSNPATYTGLYDHLRELYAQLPEARVRGYGSDRFSFNTSGGRCEACGGEGVTRIDMYFLPEIYVTCAVCKGRRYNRETLDITYKGMSIADILDLTVDQALELLANIPAIYDRLRTLREVGLGYLQLGQPASTLAGGEAQRVKLARELARRSTGRSLYVLDEPTAGLHFADVKTLLELLHRLTDLGNTIVVVEHNLEVIKSADHIIDLGPEGGERGGQLIVAGAPEAIVGVAESATGQCLRDLLGVT
jgi:excinuclease ABC subunit A